jgi:hypothetical protein
MKETTAMNKKPERLVVCGGKVIRGCPPPLPWMHGREARGQPVGRKGLEGREAATRGARGGTPGKPGFWRFTPKMRAYFLNFTKIFFCAALLLFCGGAAFSQDYGLSLRSLPVLTNGEDPYELEYTATLIPWFAAPLGDGGDIYLSGGISAEYADEDWKPVVEPYRFEAAWRFASGLRFAAGRFAYREPLNLVMNGLFDGFLLDAALGRTRFSAGAFYTGLLYKKTAYITMTPGDYEDYYDRDHYFSSRRLVFVLGWEIPGLFDMEAELELGLIAQFDLNEPDDQIEGDGKIHSQYAPVKLTLPFLDYFSAELGVIPGMIEGDGDSGVFFAFSGFLVWLPPGGLNDRLSLGAAFSSGARGDTVKAFLPINTIAQGKVLRPNISGLARAEGVYTARLYQSLSAEVSAAYFFRTDSYTYSDAELDADSLSPLLGGEVYGGLVWAPVSDISFSLGGGAFFPKLGKSFVDGASPRWRVSLETILSF